MCVPSILGVLSGSFSPLPCAQGVVGFLCVLSVHSRVPLRLFAYIHVHPGGCRVRSGAFSSFLCALCFVRVRSGHSGAFGPFPFGRSVRASWAHLVWSIPVHPRGLRVRSGAFGSLPFAGAVVRLVLSAFRPFPCAVVGFVRVGSVQSRATWGSSCLVLSCAHLRCTWCFRFITVLRGGRHVSVRSIPVRPGGPLVRKGEFVHS